MKIYSKYISLQITRLFFLNIMLLIFIIISVKLLSMLNVKALTGLNNLQMVLKLTIISIPTLMVYISPISLLCAIMYVYYTLSIDRECVVLEASGLSKAKIAQPALTIGLIITIITLCLTMYVVPMAKRSLNNYIEFMKNSVEISSIIEQKSFNRISKNITLYVDSKGTHNTFYGIALYTKESNGSQAVILSEKAELIPDGNRFVFHMHNGNRQNINNGHLQTLYFKTLKFDIPKKKLSPSSEKIFGLEEQTLVGLFSEYSKKTFDTQRRLAEIHQRIVWPIINFALASIAVASSFTTNFERKWNANKLMHASILSAVTFGLIVVASNKLHTNPVFTWILYSTPILVSLLSLYILHKKSENQPLLTKKLYKYIPKNLKKIPN